MKNPDPSKLSKAGQLPQKITDVTESISKGATKVHGMAGGMGTAIQNAGSKIKGAGQTVATQITPATQAVAKIGTAITDLQNTLEVLNATSTLVDAVVNTASGHFHPRANEQAFSSFSAKWDSWAKVVESTFQHLSPSGQANVLEQLARQNFGDNVFALGSAIKNNSAGIFGGIADFEDSIHAFRGSYRNPLEAAKKIEKGVKGIVSATERVAKSVNGMITSYQKAIGAKEEGSAILNYLGNLHNTKAVAALNKTLTAAGGTTTLISDASAVSAAFKSKDIGAIYGASKKTYDDARTLVKGLKNNSAATKVTSLSPKGSSTSGQAATANTQGSSQKEDDSSQKSDSYVCSGATMKCSMGTSQAKLTVLPSRTVYLAGQPMANISDHLSMTNLAPFGRCRSMGFPSTAAATAAAHGKLTPMPCMHNTPFPWMNGKDDYIVKGDPALLKSSTCSCMWGGTISITDNGQHGEGTQWVPKMPKETFERNQQKNKEHGINNSSKAKAQKEAIKEDNSSSKTKLKSSTASLVLPNFTGYAPQVQERIIDMANEMPDSLNIQERLKLSEHNFRIEKALNMRKGRRMTIADADNQSANPNYKKDTPFSVNCATTAAAYALRLQGFDVKAKGNSDKTPRNKWLSKGNSFKIWKNADGTDAKPTLVNDWMKQKSTREHPVTKMTPALYKQYIEENTKEEGVYIMTLEWKEVEVVNPDGSVSKKGGGGHATVIQRWKDKDGKMHLTNIESQVYDEKAGPHRSIDDLSKHLSPNPPQGKGIMRVDNKLFDTQYADIFEK